MKLDSPTVLVPHMDEDGNRCWSHFKFTGQVDKRRIKRMIYRSFPTRVHTRFVEAVMKHYTLYGNVVMQQTQVPLPDDTTETEA